MAVPSRWRGHVVFTAKSFSLQELAHGLVNGMTRGSLELLKFDRIIHEPERLMILTALYPVAKMEYLRLLREWRFKQGRLSSHLAVLEKAGYVVIEKRFKGKYPQTICGMTKKGREALELYAQMLKQVSKVTEGEQE